MIETSQDITNSHLILRKTVRHPNDLINKFIDHVHSTPNARAILTSETSLTYHELFVEVNYWKSFLSKHSLQRVVVCLERTPRLLSVLLALQWLEITYIPVDLDLPTERLITIIEDSQAEGFIFDAKSHEDYTSLPCLQLNLISAHISPPNVPRLVRGIQEICTKTLDSADKPRSVSNEVHAARDLLQVAKNPIVYIIYTSGSTGAPKGVAISTVSWNNFLNSMSQYFLNEEKALSLAITTIAFDIAALELFLPIWQKKAVLLANQEQHKDPLSLLSLLNDYPVTLLQATPSMWKILTTHP